MKSQITANKPRTTGFLISRHLCHHWSHCMAGWCHAMVHLFGENLVVIRMNNRKIQGKICQFNVIVFLLICLAGFLIPVLIGFLSTICGWWLGIQPWLFYIMCSGRITPWELPTWDILSSIDRRRFSSFHGWVAKVRTPCTYFTSYQVTSCEQRSHGCSNPFSRRKKDHHLALIGRIPR